MSRFSLIIVAVYLVYQICLNAGNENGRSNCTLKLISNNSNTSMISNIADFDFLDDNYNCIEVDNAGIDSNCTRLSECKSNLCTVLLFIDANVDDCTIDNINETCITLSNGSNCTITFTTTIVSSSIMISTSTSFGPSILISPNLSATTSTTSTISSSTVFNSVVSSESITQHLSTPSISSSIPISPSIPISSAISSVISSSTAVVTSVVSAESTRHQYTSSQSTSSSSPSVTVQPTFQLSDLIEEPYIYYWPPGLVLIMLMCCSCIFCLILCTRIRSWKSKMQAYKFVIAHDCGIQDLKYIDLPSRYDSKIEFTTFKNLSKLDNKEDAKETELEAGATGEFGEGIPGVIIMESEPVTDLETQALITGEDSEKTDEEKKDDAKDEPKDTSESKQQETGGIEVSIIIESSIIDVEAKTTADAQTSVSDDIDCFSKESTTVDTSGIENNPKPLAAVDVTDGSTKQEVSPKQTIGDEKQSKKEEEGKEDERKPEDDVKKEESKMEDKQEAGKKDLSEDTLTKSMDAFNIQLGAILDLIKDDDKDTKTQTVM